MAHSVGPHDTATDPPTQRRTTRHSDGPPDTATDPQTQRRSPRHVGGAPDTASDHSTQRRTPRHSEGPPDTTTDPLTRRRTTQHSSMCLLQYVNGRKLCSCKQNTKSSNLHHQKHMALVSWMLNLKVSLCVAGFFA